MPAGEVGAGPYNRAMPVLRRHRLTTVLLALFSLLFMQLAVAGYSCPVSGSQGHGVAAMAQADMPCAESMTGPVDEAQPNLCHAHCQGGEQASDNQPAQLPVMGFGSLSFLTVALLAPPVPGTAPLPSLIARQTAPPLAIRNCCLRL